MNPLSNTEWLVASYLPQGLANKEIARKMDIAETTVKVHLRAISKKLGVNNRTQIAILIDRQHRGRLPAMEQMR